MEYMVSLTLLFITFDKIEYQFENSDNKYRHVEIVCKIYLDII